MDDPLIKALPANANGKTQKVLAYLMVAFFVIYSLIVLLAIYYTEKVEKEVLATVTAMSGTVLGYAMREISLVYELYFRRPENPPESTSKPS